MSQSQIKTDSEKRKTANTKWEKVSISNVRFNYSTFNLRFSLLFFSLSCSSKTNQGSRKKCKRKPTPKPATHNRVGKFFDLSDLLSYLFENLLTLRGHHTGGGEDKRVKSACDVTNASGLPARRKSWDGEREELRVKGDTTLISKYACRIRLQNPTHLC